MERELLNTKRRVLGSDHPSVLATKGNLACSLSRQGKHAEAEHMLSELLELRRQVLGADHPDTLATAKNLSVSIAGRRSESSARGMLWHLARSIASVLRSLWHCLIHALHPRPPPQALEEGVPTREARSSSAADQHSDVPPAKRHGRR